VTKRYRVNRESVREEKGRERREKREGELVLGGR
jgi:hypothetical protein